MNLYDILNMRGFDMNSRTKLMRHQSQYYDTNEIFRSGHINAYQSVQSKDILKCDYLISFIGQHQTKAYFAGIWKVKGQVPYQTVNIGVDFPYPEFFDRPDDIHYDLEEVKGYEDLIGRIVIDWGKATRSWHQWLRDKPILEIKPKGYISPFSGYLDFALSHRDLSDMVAYPDANRVWHQMLKSTAGVYLIMDRLTGQQYVGSAYGKDGILGRWRQYALNGHGGNVELKRLLISDNEYAANFQFTILRTLPSSLTSKEVIAYEKLYKDKLGSRAHGLNLN